MLNSDRCLISGFQRQGPAPRLGLASHPAVRLNPPPTPLPGQSPTWQGGCTHSTLSYSLVFPGAANLPAPPPPLPRKNAEKLEGLGYSPPLPRLGAAGWSSWEERTQESGIWSFEGMLRVPGPEPQGGEGAQGTAQGWAGVSRCLAASPSPSPQAGLSASESLPS